MDPKVPQTLTELEEHLTDQLRFLEQSADAYDQGFDGEAKRLAVALRILLYDKGQSKSLLGQLNKLSASFFNTAIPHNPKNLSTHSGLIMIAMAGKATKYIPHLDNAPDRRWTLFPDWWSEIVFVDDARATLSRKDLVLAVADQDGGAHVDPSLSAIYSRLSRSNSMGWVSTVAGQSTPIRPPERAAIRQIAHEVLKTLNPRYGKKVEHNAEMYFGAAMMFEGSELEPVRNWKPAPVPERNGRCPCGSGRKYKKCHGFAV